MSRFVDLGLTMVLLHDWLGCQEGRWLPPGDVLDCAACMGKAKTLFRVMDAANGRAVDAT